MTATFWTGSSLSFTNGSKTVTVNTGPSLDSVKANSALTAGNYNEPVEVKSVSGNTITLYNNWPGSTGTTSATIKPSAAAAASAGVAAQQLITEIQSLVGSASATATANSFVKRDSNGRMKAAAPSANDDVVTKGYLGAAATRGVGTDPNQLMPVGAFNLGERFSNVSETVDFSDMENINQFLGWVSSSSAPSSSFIANGSAGVRFAAGTVRFADLLIVNQGVTSPEQALMVFKSHDSESSSGWVSVLHSGRFTHAQNTSGATVAANSTVSGSSLTPSKSGTWRNVSGVSISANNYGLWMSV